MTTTQVKDPVHGHVELDQSLLDDVVDTLVPRGTEKRARALLVDLFHAERDARD